MARYLRSRTNHEYIFSKATLEGSSLTTPGQQKVCTVWDFCSFYSLRLFVLSLTLNKLAIFFKFLSKAFEAFLLQAVNGKDEGNFLIVED